MQKYSRQDFIKQLDEWDQEQSLREHIRMKLKEKLSGKFQDEMFLERLTSFIRTTLLEGQEDTPHKATGINVLEDLLKKIVPILEQDYKQLTTSASQRKSYRAHIVRAVQNSLAPTIQNSKQSDNKPPQLAPQGGAELQEVDVDVGGDVESALETDPSVGDNGYIDIEKDKKKNKEGGGNTKKDDQMKNFAIPGEDETGRNFAMKTFTKVERQIIDAYDVLSDPRDQEIFYDYLLTNLKLYFDKFEDEMSSIVQEPTTPEYEREKEKAASEPPPEAGGEEIPPEEEGVPTL